MISLIFLIDDVEDVENVQRKTSKKWQIKKTGRILHRETWTVEKKVEAKVTVKHFYHFKEGTYSPCHVQDSLSGQL